MADDKSKEQVSPTRKRQDAKREKDVAEFNRQVEEGSVVIRKMTPKERRENPPQDRPPKRGKK